MLYTIISILAVDFRCAHVCVCVHACVCARAFLQSISLFDALACECV